MSKSTWVNIADIWKKVKNVWVNVGGTWKQKVIPKGNISGIWKDFMSYSFFIQLPNNFAYSTDYNNFAIDGNFLYVLGGNGTYGAINKYDKYGNLVLSESYISAVKMVVKNNKIYANNNDNTIYIRDTATLQMLSYKTTSCNAITQIMPRDDGVVFFAAANMNFFYYNPNTNLVVELQTMSTYEPAMITVGNELFIQKHYSDGSNLLKFDVNFNVVFSIHFDNILKLLYSNGYIYVQTATNTVAKVDSSTGSIVSTYTLSNNINMGFATNGVNFFISNNKKFIKYDLNFNKILELTIPNNDQSKSVAYADSENIYYLKYDVSDWNNKKSFLGKM